MINDYKINRDENVLMVRVTKKVFINKKRGPLKKRKVAVTSWINLY